MALSDEMLATLSVEIHKRLNGPPELRQGPRPCWRNWRKTGFKVVCRSSLFCTGMASPRGFEPPTSGLGNRCSIQLSYGDVVRYLAKALLPVIHAIRVR